MVDVSSTPSSIATDAKADDRTPSSSSSSSDDAKPKVFLRLRPMNKLEASKRSKDCIELRDDDTTKVNVDSPLQGLFEFAFDSVFDELASQTEVYQESLTNIPYKLLQQGTDCTVLAFGQTSTGKTHLILGESPTSDLLELVEPSQQRRRRRQERENDKTTPQQQQKCSQQLNPSQGIMARVVVDLFEYIQTQMPPSTECILKFSMVELYLERFTDLLLPTNADKSSIWVDSQSQLHGASELCCVHPQDVIRAMIRGSLVRMKSATEQNQDATRSHVVLQLKVCQINRTMNRVGTTTLRMVDLAGSEQGKSRSSRQLDSPLALEGRMVSASLQSLFNYIRAKVASQSPTNKGGSGAGRGGGRMQPPQAYANVSKLTRLLQSSLDGPCYLTTFLTASPSSYNIGETLNTLRFGATLQRLKLALPITSPTESSNSPRIWTKLAICDYPAKYKQAERRVENLTRFVKLLAVECRIVRKTGKIKQPHAVWDVISRIAKSSTDMDDDDLIITVTRKGDAINNNKKEGEVDETSAIQKLQEAQAAKEKAESSMRDYQSEVTSLKAETELLSKEKKRLERELLESREELKQMAEAKAEADRHLRTSKFRENEAVVFLRQFRSFYLRLLKSKALHGNGEVNLIVNDVIQNVTGAADLKDLLDVDRLMVQSGLIEANESSEDTNDPNYAPSQQATEKSENEAAQAESRELKALEALKGGRMESGEVTVYRQMLVESPAGRLAIKKEKELEASIIELSSKCVGLQNALNAEKSMVEALSARQGALGKMKAAQEMSLLKSELERRSNDLQAIVWKMNELHLVNKTVNAKAENRESHVAYLEETLTTHQNKLRQLISEKQEDEKKLREENEALQLQLKGSAVKLWQLGEETSDFGNRWKVIVPASGEPVDLNSTKLERRISVGDIADEGIELLEPPGEKKHEVSMATQTDPEPVETCDADMQTEEIILDIDDAAVQTDPVQVLEIGEEKSIEKASSPSESSSASVQTETTASETVEMSVRTESTGKGEVDCQDIGVQTISELHYDVGVQTDEVLSVPVLLKGETSDTAMQTDHTAADFVSSSSKVEMVETGIQTEMERIKICFEATTQTNDLPNEIIAFDENKGYDSSGSLGQDMDEEDIKAHSIRPPKPRAAERSHAAKEAPNFQSSFASLGSIGSFKRLEQPSPRPMEKLSVSMKWSGNVPSVAVEDRLGASMSVLQGPSQKTTDWKAKLKQRSEDTPSSSVPLHVSGSGAKPRWSVPSMGKCNDPSTPKGNRKSSVTAGGSTDANVPEWMSKFREIGIKADDDDDHVDKEEDKTAAKSQNQAKSSPIPAVGVNAFGGIPPMPPDSSTEKPEWMQKLKSSKSPISKTTKPLVTSILGPAAGEKMESLPPAPWAKHTMRRASIAGSTLAPASTEPVVAHVSASLSKKEPEWAQARRATMAAATVEISRPPMAATVSSTVDDPPSSLLSPVQQQQPEWMQKFKEIGMKGEEKVIERLAGEQQNKTTLQEKEPSLPSGEKKPEWMLKFQQITGGSNEGPAGGN